MSVQSVWSWTVTAGRGPRHPLIQGRVVSGRSQNGQLGFSPPHHGWSLKPPGSLTFFSPVPVGPDTDADLLCILLLDRISLRMGLLE